MTAHFWLTLCSLSVSVAFPFDATEEDEFSMRSDPTFSRVESVSGSTTGILGEGKLSLLGLWSSQWARQKIALGTTEYFSIMVMVLYLIVYVKGRRRSYEIADSYMRRVHGLFCSRFLEAGPACQFPPADKLQLLARESPNSFLYYATGSRACDGVLVRISLANRHDIFMLVWRLFSPAKDTVTVEVALDDEDIEPIIFAVTRKRSIKQLLIDVPHLEDFTGVVRSPHIPPELVCLAETPALVESLLPPAINTLSDYPDLLELIHFTDQNDVAIAGRKETPKKMMRIQFRMDNLQGAEKMMELALTYVDFLHK